MIQIITKFNSSIPSVRKVKNWLLNDPFHVWHGRDRLVVFFILAGDEAANAFLPLPDGDFSVEDESIRAIFRDYPSAGVRKKEILSAGLSETL